MRSKTASQHSSGKSSQAFGISEEERVREKERDHEERRRKLGNWSEKKEDVTSNHFVKGLVVDTREFWDSNVWSTGKTDLAKQGL